MISIRLQVHNYLCDIVHWGRVIIYRQGGVGGFGGYHWIFKMTERGRGGRGGGGGESVITESPKEGITICQMPIQTWLFGT